MNWREEKCQNRSEEPFLLALPDPFVGRWASLYLGSKMNVYSNAVRHLPEVMSSEKFERVAGQAARTFYDCEVTNALRAR